MNVSIDKKILIPILALLLGLLACGGYFYYKTYTELNITRGELASTTSALESMRVENECVSYDFYIEQQKNSDFQKQITDIAGTVGLLDRLSKTDKELLQKYSRVYFLNEHYIPESLATITPEYLLEKNKLVQMHSRVLPYFQDMVRNAKSDGVDLLVISVYRSFNTQETLKVGYTLTYGSGANSFSADQGYSEHQLGTALDLTTEKLGAGFTSFDTSDGYKWLVANAHRYGFVLSYPKGNNYYKFEPWHWRFVGRSLARKMHEEGQHFYDLEQRSIDQYLINIFD